MEDAVLITSWEYGMPNEDGHIEAFFKVDGKCYKILVTAKDAKTMNHWHELHKLEKEG